MRIRFAHADELDRVERFYRGTRYDGGVLASDRIVLLELGNRIAGAYRLAAEGGVLVLRGMRVSPELRGHGLGRLLLTVLVTLREPCHCVPHAHLQPFYGRVGFSPLPRGQGPAFLQDRIRAYRARGLDVVLMLRAS
jgi:GNAT superfamily N-acetyltransferase